MKIYFAFRSGYEKTTRYVKEFEADSVLDWFQKNWDTFQGEYGCEENLLGVHVYGFPIDDEDLEEGQKVQKPKTLSQLKAQIEEYIYQNETKINANCLQVYTDDDEIELAWYVFDEKFIENNPDKIAIWLNGYLPTTFGNNGLKLASKCIEITPNGTENGCVYYGSNPFYDSGNFETLEGLYKIENIRLPTLLNYLRANQINVKKGAEPTYGLNELRFIQFIAKQLPTANFTEIIEMLGKMPLTELEDIDLENLDNYSLNDIMKTNTENFEPSKSSFIKINEHCCEWNTVAMDMFHNYFVFFDDLWVEKNESFAKNLAQFTKTWQL